MTRWRASALHLGLSLLIGAGFAALTRFVWYPGPFFENSGAVGLLTILVPVDIVIGPLLTLLVFKSGKPSLRFDLTVIALLQTAALAYGAWTIAEVRPAYVVFFGNQLKVVRSTDIAEQAPWRTPLAGPQWVGIPSEGALAAEVADLMAGLSGKKAAAMDSQQYQPWATAQAAFRQALRPIAELTPATAAKTVQDELTTRGFEVASLRALPITVRDQKMTAVFAENSDELIAIVPVALLAH